MAKTLTIEFSVTTGCNLRCAYCYSNHKPQYMNFEVCDKFFEVVGDFMEIYGCDGYHISYFGGEPLENFEVIKYTLPKFNEDKRCKSTCIITNGTLLTEEIVLFLKQYNCGISFSFDGINQSKNRPMANKEDSFETILKKKEIIKSITNSCKVMIDPRSLKNMTENFEFFVNEFGFNNPDFSLVRDNIYTSKDIENYKEEIHKLANKVIAYNLGYENYEDIHIKSPDRTPIYCNVGLFRLYILDIIVNKRYGKRNHGCFVGYSGGVYTTDGDIYPCERFRSVKKYQLYDNKTKTFNKENINFLKDPKVSDPRTFEKCKSCELYEVCNVGCTYSQLLNGKFEKSQPIDSVCEILKLTYKEAMRVFHESGEHFRNRLLSELDKIG